jgi:hypothetical protein
MNENRNLQSSLQREKGSGADKILADIFRQVAHTVLPILPRLIDQFLERRGKYKNTKEMASARGNITKELSADTMTWKVFCRSLEILAIKKMVIRLDITWRNNKTLVYTKPVIFNQTEEEYDVEDKESEE